MAFCPPLWSMRMRWPGSSNDLKIYRGSGPFETEAYTDPQKRRSHLNSDIGGLNYNAIASSSRKKKKESGAESVE